MTRKSLAVAVLHGVGAYPPFSRGRTDELSFSAGLKTRIAAHLDGRGGGAGRRAFEDRVAWREVRYAHVFQDVQQAYLGALDPAVRTGRARRLMVENIGDAASYRPDRSQDPDGPRSYDRVHENLAQTLGELEAEIEPEAPLMILAHSLGGHVASNYLWDAQRPGATSSGAPLSAFQRGKRLCALITFGCNIPLFLFGLSRDKVRALAFPGTHCDPRFIEPTWWFNFYDRDDPLGYPLGAWGAGYERMRAEGTLIDIEVNVGAWWRRWNLLSHNGYWTGKDFYAAAANRIARALAASQKS